MNTLIRKEIVAVIFLIVLGVAMYALTLRGSFGNSTPDMFKENLDKPTKAFELSPERGRYVHVVNLAESGKYNLTEEWRDVAYPDVGVLDGKYYSFFAPGVAYFSLPAYILGGKYNAGQLAVFFFVSLVSILSLVTIYFISKNIFKLPIHLALFASIIFGFASSAWSYSTTLYQHAFTTFFIVSAFYAVWKFKQCELKQKSGFLYSAYAWLAYALAILVDYPNAILMLPVMVYLAISAFSATKDAGENIHIKIRFAAVTSIIAFLVVTGLHFWHNDHYLGSWKQLSGGIPSYKPVAENNAQNSSPSEIGKFTVADSKDFLNTNQPSETTSPSVVKKKDIVGFFSEWHMPKSFFVLLFSDERGLFFFYPIFILSIFGLAIVFIKHQLSAEFVIPLSLILINIFLYSAWGDPWGGWAFGPRYLIPSMAWLAIFAVYFIRGNGVFIKKIITYALFLFSSAVALLGTITTNAVPPKSEALLLPIKKFNFLKNLDFLAGDQSSSFIYNTYLIGNMTLLSYFIAVFIIIALVSSVVLFAFNNKEQI